MQKQSKWLKVKVKFKTKVELVQSNFSLVVYSVSVSELLLEHSVTCRETEKLAVHHWGP